MLDESKQASFLHDLVVVPVVLDEEGKVLLQASGAHYAWMLPSISLQGFVHPVQAAQSLTRTDFSANFIYHDYIGTYADKYSLREVGSQPRHIVAIALLGMLDAEASSVESVGIRFHAPWQMPPISERVYLDILTDCFAGRRGVLR